MARMKFGRGGDRLDEIAPGLKLDMHPNVRRITGFDLQVLVTAIAQDRHGQSFGLLTLWGWDLVWMIEGTATDRVLTVVLATDWAQT